MGGEDKNHVLIVDDDPVNLKILNKMLSDEYDVSVATNGGDALVFAQAVKPDLILLDIMMPGMSGVEVCKTLKDDDFLCNIPVIFISALDELDDETEGLAAGACDYITKPIKEAIVMARIKIHLRNRMYEEFLELLLSNKGQELEAVKAEAQRLRMLDSQAQ